MLEKEILALRTQAATLLEQGRQADARAIYEKVCASNHATAGDHYRLATLLHAAGSPQDALASLQKAIDTEPDYAPAWHMSGALYGMQNRHAEAVTSFREALGLQPRATETRLNLAHALLQLGQWEAAAEQCLLVTGENPAIIRAWSMLGRSQAERGQYEAATESYRQALKLKPDLLQPLIGLGYALYHQDLWDESLPCFRQALRLNPALASVHFGIGSALLKIRNLQEALHHLQEAARLEPGHAEAHLGVGTVLSLMGRQKESVAHMRKALQLQPDFGYACIVLSATLMTLGKPDEAQQLCDQALDLEPDNVEAITLAAYIDQHRGNIDSAHERLRPLIEAGSRDINVALAYSTICSKLGETGTGIEYMEHLLREDRSVTGTGRLNLHFNLGKLYDRQKDYRNAFDHYRRGNEIKQAEFDPRKQTSEADTVIAIHTRALQDRLPRATHGSDRPVFILGMPRSGTSLTEQILASHPDVFGAGELPDIIRIAERLGESSGHGGYPLFVPGLTQQQLDDAARLYLDHITTLSADTARVIDKMPGNFMFIGLIELLFPDAVIIHTRRDPLDTCLSCYFQNFSRSQNYSYNLAHLGAFYRNYQRLMDHWRRTISLPMLEVQYEDLIADQEAGSRRIIEFCGLPWDEQCLQFHKTDRYVATASYDQVRQPIYKSSVRRWENYAEFIEPLRKALAASPDSGNS